MIGVLGIDTIKGAAPENERKFGLRRTLLKKQSDISYEWNNSWVAMLPFCISCKEPLIWHSPPGEDGVLFHCPKCKRTWVKDNGWEKETANNEGKIRP